MPLPSDASTRLVRASADRLAAASARHRAALAMLLGLARETDVRALQHLLGGELTPGGLARRIVLTSSGTTSVINRLCRAELVSRHPSPGGGRRVVLRATPTAEPRIAAATAPLVAEIDAIVNDLR